MTRGDLAALAALALALRAAAAWAIPHGHDPRDANCAPDEQMHLEFVRHLARGDAPVWPATWSVYSVFPPAPYAAHAATLAAARAPGAHLEETVPRPGALEHRGYLAARGGAILLGVLAVLLVAAAASAWTSDRAVGWSAGLVAALYPQHLFVSAYVNADAYTFAAQAALLLALARWARGGEADDGVPAVAAAAALVLLGKPSGFHVLPPAALWVAWAAARRRISARALVAGVVALVAVAAPMLAWNAWRTGGDALGLAHYARFMREVWQGTPMSRIPDAWPRFFRVLAKSAFALFGNATTRLPGGAYVGAGALAVVGAAALGRRLVRAEPVARRAAAWFVASCVLNFGLLVWSCERYDFQPQGRFALFSAVGLVGLGALAPHALSSPRWRRALAALPLAFLAVAAAQTVSVLVRRPCG